MKIDVELPVSYKKIVHVQRIETDELEACKPKIIKERKGILGFKVGEYLPQQFFFA